MSQKILALSALYQASLALKTKITPLEIDSTTRSFIDRDNRQVILHGVNVVPKVAPYIPVTDKFDPQTSLNQQDMDDLNRWGLNFIRLGVMWEAVERQPGVYDHEYLDKIEALINNLGKNGIYVLVDAHQDVGVRRLCGEGFPNFYADDLSHHCEGWDPSMLNDGKCINMASYGWRLDQDGNPLLEDCVKVGFGNYYGTSEAIDLNNRFFTNKDGFKDKFVAYWKVVSEKFAGNPYVVGYDPWNEPGSPALNYDPSIFYTNGGPDQEKLSPLYSELFNEYMSHDKSKIMMFEPNQYPNSLQLRNGLTMPVGFTDLPGGADFKENQVLNDHTYCCVAGHGVCDTGEPTLEHHDLCLRYHNDRLETRDQDAAYLKIPFIVTEFGACFDSAGCAMEIKLIADKLDKLKVGWAYWQLKKYWDFTTSASVGNEGFYNDDGTLQTVKVKALARSYLPFTQGRIVENFFQTESGQFDASILVDTTIDAPTVLFTSEEFWGQGPNKRVRLTDDNGHELTDDQVDIVDEGNYFHFQIQDPALHQQVVHLRAAPGEQFFIEE